MDYYIAKVSCQYTRLQRQQHATRKPKQTYRHVSPKLAAIITVTFHPSISGSMHADGLPHTIYLQTLVLIPEAAFILKCRQTYKETDKIRDISDRPISHASATASMG